MSVIDDFCADYHTYHSISPARRERQRAVLRRLVRHAGAAEEIDAQAVRAYLTSRLESGSAPTTVRLELNAIRPFFRWCWQQQIIDAERWMQMGELRAPRAAGRDGVPRPYSRDELDRFWSELDETWPRAEGRFVARFERGTSPWRRVRVHGGRLQREAIATLAVYGGLRMGEIFRLKFEDMHPDNSVVIATSRKNERSEWTPRGVPMFSPMRTAIEEWFAFRALLTPAHESPWLSMWALAGTERSDPLSWKRFQVLMSKLGTGWEFHRFRHTAATEMLRAGMSLEQVSKILGHANLQQTLGYAQLVHRDLIAAAEKADARFELAVGPTKEAA